MASKKERHTSKDSKPQRELTLWEITQRSAATGKAAGYSSFIQVLTLMSLRTTMNYQYRHGGDFWPTFKKLYHEGGIARLYRGIIPAMMILFTSKFGDAFTNELVKQLYLGNPYLASTPIIFRTIAASVLNLSWKLITLPIDQWKTYKQVHGADGAQILINNVK